MGGSNGLLLTFLIRHIKLCFSHYLSSTSHERLVEFRFQLTPVCRIECFAEIENHLCGQLVCFLSLLEAATFRLRGDGVNRCLCYPHVYFTIFVIILAEWMSVSCYCCVLFWRVSNKLIIGSNVT